MQRKFHIFYLFSLSASNLIYHAHFTTYSYKSLAHFRFKPQQLRGHENAKLPWIIAVDRCERARDRLHIFPHLQQVTYFPALAPKGYIFPRNSPRLICLPAPQFGETTGHVFLRFS